MERKAKLPKFERDVSSLPKFDFSYSIMQFIYTFLDFADHLSLQKTSPRWEWMGNKEKSWAPALTVDTQGEFVQAFNSGCKKLFALTYTGLYTVYFFYETGLYKRPPPLTWWNQLRTLCLVHRDKSFNNLLAKGEINRHQELKSLTTLQLQGWCYPLHSARHLPPTLTALEATLYVSAGSNPWSADALPLLRRVKLAYEVCPYGHWTPYAEDVLPHRHPLLESVDVDIANLRIGYVDGLGRWESLDWKTQCLTSLRISSSSGGWDIVYHGPEIFRNLMEANKGLKRLELPGNNICDKREFSCECMSNCVYCSGVFGEGGD